MTLDLTPEQRSDVIVAFLSVGTPPTAVARALGVDEEYVKGALDLMHTERYGTDDLAGAMTFLIWEAYEEALHQIHHGTPAAKARFIQLVLARSIGLAGKADAGMAEKIRDALNQMNEDLAPDVQLEPSIYDPAE